MWWRMKALRSCGKAQFEEQLSSQASGRKSKLEKGNLPHKSQCSGSFQVNVNT